VASALGAPVGLADTAPIQATPDLPWTNPAHQSNLEVLASTIASHIAGRAVTVRCEGDTDWFALVTQGGGDPNAELGYVSALFRSNGQISSISNFAELQGTNVCLQLKDFATATTKPTKCSITPAGPRFVSKRLQSRVVVIVNGKRRVKTAWTTKTVTVPGAASTSVPCFGANGLPATTGMSNSYWDAYDGYVEAILTIAHESIHLGGMVGGVLSNGVLAGDQQAEAKANCSGMQWMPYVAQQLGDTADDAQGIADFFWTVDYPQLKGSSLSQYWSADCRPGGPMDIRSAGSTAWP
jgi:hypothetical protein